MSKDSYLLIIAKLQILQSVCESDSRR